MKKIIAVLIIIFIIAIGSMFYWYLHLHNKNIQKKQNSVVKKNFIESKLEKVNLYKKNQKDIKNIEIYENNKKEIEKLGVKSKDELREKISISFSKSKFSDFEVYVKMLDPLWDIINDTKSTPKQKAIATRKIVMFYWENNRDPKTLKYIFKNNFKKYHNKENISLAEEKILKYANSLYKEHIAVIYLAFIKARQLATAKYNKDNIFLKNNQKPYLKDIKEKIKESNLLVYKNNFDSTVDKFKYTNIELLTKGLLSYIENIDTNYEDEYQVFLKNLQENINKTRHAKTFLPVVSYFYLAISDLNKKEIKNKEKVIEILNKYSKESPHLKLILEQIKVNKSKGQRLDIIDFLLLNEQLQNNLNIK